jgi:hypothetical protein
VTGSAVVVLGGVAVVWGQSQTPNTIAPKGYSFEFEGQKWTRVREGAGFLTEAKSGKTRLWSDGSSFSGELEDGTQAWAKVDKAGTHDIAGASDHAAYILERSTREKEVSPKEVLRLDTKTGKWLEPLKWSGEVKDKEVVSIAGVAADEQRVAVLYQFSTQGKDDWYPKVVRNIVQVYSEPGGKSLWTLEVPVAEGGGPAHGLLLAASYPNFAESDVRTLTWAARRLVVCPGNKGPLVSIDESGKQEWIVERPWEFSRGFTGPSVWSDHVGRFGYPSYGDEGAGDPAMRKKFEEMFSGHIIAGPILVEKPDQNGYGDSYYLAVSLANTGPYSGYTGDCILYEFDNSGRAKTRTVIPQMIVGQNVRVVPGGIIWGLQNKGLMRTRIETEFVFRMGPGSPDSIAAIDWLTQSKNKKEMEWKSFEAVSDTIAIGQKSIFRAHEGWTIDLKDPNLMHFPISVIDVETGSTRTATLSAILPPEEKRAKIDPQIKHGGYGVMFAGVDENRLRFQIATTDGTNYVEFEIPAGER